MSREETKRRFRRGDAQVMVCTDAAAEGLNFQFCGALINFDCPWNPMRVEQRIGRVDRLGQRFERIAIVNLCTRARSRPTCIGRSGHESTCSPPSSADSAHPFVDAATPCRRGADRSDDRQQARANSDAHCSTKPMRRPGFFDIDDAIDAGLSWRSGQPLPMGLEDLGQLLDHQKLLPPGLRGRPGQFEGRFWLQPGAPKVRSRRTRNSSRNMRTRSSFGRLAALHFRPSRVAQTWKFSDAASTDDS